MMSARIYQKQVHHWEKIFHTRLSIHISWWSTRDTRIIAGGSLCWYCPDTSAPVSQPRLRSSLPIPSLSVKVTLVESRHWHCDWNISDHVKISEIVNCVNISMETRNWNIQLWHKQCYKMFYKIETLFYTFAFLSGKKWTQDPSQLFLFSLSKRIFEGREQNKFCWRKKWNLKAMSISL